MTKKYISKLYKLLFTLILSLESEISMLHHEHSVNSTAQKKQLTDVLSKLTLLFKELQKISKSSTKDNMRNIKNDQEIIERFIKNLNPERDRL